MRLHTVLLGMLVCVIPACIASAAWELFEQTRVEGRLTGITKKGSAIQMQSGSIYEVSEVTEQDVTADTSKVTVMRDGVRFLVAIEGFSKALICRQIAPPSRDADSTKPQPEPKPPSAIKLPARTRSGISTIDPLAQLMPPSKQRQIGVDKLTKEEQTSLRLFLIELYLRGVQDGRAQAASKIPKPPTPTASGTIPQGSSVSRGGGSTVSAIESKVDGEFTGWEGDTVVKLMNGQIWQQTEFYYHYHYAYMPDALVYKSGTRYKMKIEGVDRAVTVERIK